MKSRYLSIGMLTGALLCSAVALTVSAQTTKEATPAAPNAQTDAESKLLDETLGGAIAPRNMDGIDVPKYSGELSDRIANDKDSAVIRTDDNREKTLKPKRPRLSRQPGYNAFDPTFGSEERENPFAPKRIEHENKVSFGEPTRMSYAPGYGPPELILTSEQLKTLSILSHKRVNINRLTAKQEAEFGLPEGTSTMMNNMQQLRIDGMLPFEALCKTNVDTVMKIVSSRAEGEERRKAAEAGFDRLSEMADSMRFIKSIPETTYLAMGMSDTYISETKEDYGNGLGRLQEALEALAEIKKGE